MRKYMLTDQNDETRGNTKWGINITHETDDSIGLCSRGWLHYYHTPELAILLNPIHANISNPKLWECAAEGKQLDDFGLKGGCMKLTTIREIPLPECSIEQRIEFGIRCALEVCDYDDFVAWAKSWLDGSDRSRESAYAAADAAWAAAWATHATADAAAYAATGAADATADAAWATYAAPHAADCAVHHSSFKPDRLAAIAAQVLAS